MKGTRLGMTANYPQASDAALLGGFCSTHSTCETLNLFSLHHSRLPAQILSPPLWPWKDLPIWQKQKPAQGRDLSASVPSKGIAKEAKKARLIFETDIRRKSKELAAHALTTSRSKGHLEHRGFPQRPGIAGAVPMGRRDAARGICICPKLPGNSPRPAARMGHPNS